jgi:hypothetical protein
VNTKQAREHEGEELEALASAARDASEKLMEAIRRRNEYLDRTVGNVVRLNASIFRQQDFDRLCAEANEAFQENDRKQMAWVDAMHARGML